MYVFGKKSGIRDSDEKVRDSRKKGAGMQDQNPLPDPVCPSLI